jgi:lambda family phage portal protein
VEGGDAFGRLRMRRPNDGLAVPLQIQLLEAEHCPSTMNQAYGGNHIVGGVEITPFGARAAYWFHPEHPEDQFTRWSVGTGERRVPANQVFHTMQMRRIGQLRGEPWLTRAYIIAAELHGYRDAESVRKKIAALLVGWRKRPVPDHLDAEELEKLWSAADEEEDGILHGDVKPGTILDLDFGEDMGFNTPADVGGNFEAYVVDTNRAFAAAAGTLYEHITGDYGKLNDRTLRAAVNEFRRRAAMWQHQMVAFQMCRPVHRAWIQAATLSRAIRAPAGMTDAQLMMVKWVPQAWPYIHPVQDIEADTAAVRAGFTSRQAVVAKRGRDASEVDEEQQADNQRADDRRISYDSDARRASNDPTKQRTEERTDAE